MRISGIMHRIGEIISAKVLRKSSWWGRRSISAILERRRELRLIVLRGGFKWSDVLLRPWGLRRWLLSGCIGARRLGWSSIVVLLCD